MELLVTPLECTLAGWKQRVIVRPGSRAARLYDGSSTVEDYFCNYGLNPAYRRPLEESGLSVSGTDDTGEVRLVELDSHPFFLATLFCLQPRSGPGRLHPLVTGFVEAGRLRRKR